ncbi:putative metalloprotease CJM1_0395 family protein [Marinagarivorans algicola]|uniref:putative metalloprotease CJM1_0395 family protein n=1 Tax=Marinagarivorans algicola TaxID=1513270 RepID=UPI0006B431C5|nr:putative metalloprotease CJM1_0395 family protein [Marinagarivorans algicola]
MNIPNALHPLPTSSAAPTVSYSPAASTHQTDLQASVFKPVSQVAQAEKQTVAFKPGTVPSPLHNAVQAYGFEPDVAASLVTYGANGKLTALPGARSTADVILSGQARSSAEEGATGSDVAATSNDHTGDKRSIGNGGELSDEANTGQALETEKQKAQRIKEQEQEEIRMLAARDREVRTHEQAHAAVGGAYAGAPKYQFEQGPDGVNYAIGGEVPIDVGPAATPEQTLEKAQTVRRAAMAPSEPSPQDRQVAQEATQLEAQARQQLAAQRAQELAAKNESGSAEVSIDQAEIEASAEPLALNAQSASIRLADTGFDHTDARSSGASASDTASLSAVVTSASSDERTSDDLTSRIAQAYRAVSEPIDEHLRVLA